MSNPDLDAIRGGASRRALLALPALVALGAGAWWLLRSPNLGEPELAHEVLIIASAEADLSDAVSPAGFEADHETWSQHQGEDLDALIDAADERGYGFLTLVFDEAAPWPATELDPSAPEDAAAVAISIGDLRERGADPVLRFGAPVPGLDISDSLRAVTSLRVALYDHPDLLRLWTNPSPAQRSQQVHLGALEDRRTELHARLERQRDAAASWPREAIPADALSEPWVNFTGLPIASGVVFERAPVDLVVDAALTPRIEADRGARELLWLDHDSFAQLDAAAPVELLPDLGELTISPNRRYLAQSSYGGSVRRWEVDPEAPGPGISELPEVSLVGDAYEIAVSNTGAILGRHDSDELVTAARSYPFVDDIIQGWGWYGDELIVAQITGAFGHGGADQALVFLDARPPARDREGAARDDPEHGPRAGDYALTLYPRDLSLADGRAATLATFAVSADAVFVLVNIRDGHQLRHLVRVALDPEALLPSGREGYDHIAQRQTSPTPEQLRAGDGGVEIRVLGQLPPTKTFMVSNDGGWVAWWDDNEQGTLQAAPVTASGLGEVTTVATLGSHHWSRSRRPQFADDHTLLVPQRASHALGEAAFLRLVSL